MTQMALRLLRPRYTRDQRRLCPCRGPLSLSHRGGDGERVTAASRPRLAQLRVWRGLEPCRSQPPACSQGSQVTCQPEAGSSEKARIRLLLHSLPEDHHSADHSLKSPLTITP